MSLMTTDEVQVCDIMAKSVDPNGAFLFRSRLFSQACPSEYLLKIWHEVPPLSPYPKMIERLLVVCENTKNIGISEHIAL